MEINRLREYFATNSYPNYLFDKFLRRFLNTKFSPLQQIEKSQDDIRYVTLPFQGHYSYHIRNKVQKLLKLHLPDISFRFIFTNSLTIGSFFRYKDKIPDSLCSNVVYDFQCPVCRARYIGSTCRNLRIRISEHKGFSYRSNKPLTNPSASMIREHSRHLDHPIKENSFRILFKAYNRNDLRIAETLNIIDQKPTLNSYETCIKLNLL